MTQRRAKAMRRLKKLLPNKYFLDKHFNPLVDDISGLVYENERQFDDGLHNKLTYEEIKDIVHDTLACIKPKYSLKTKKHY